MLYKITADIVVFAHFLWIVFLVLGAFLGKRNKVIRVFHIGGLGFAVTIQIFGWYCPLTYLEFYLRSRHDPSLTYEGSFIVHYLERLIYIEVSQGLLFVLTILLCGFNVWFYLRRH